MKPKTNIAMKKNDYKYFVGIDVSKKTLDMSLVVKEGMRVLDSTRIENCKSGLKRMGVWLKTFNLKLEDVVFCLEFTGVYNEPVLSYLSKLNAFVWLEMPIKIIRSSGLQRGKNDKVDAIKIAIYAAKNSENMQRWVQPGKTIQIVRDLISLRNRLIKALKMMLQPINELEDMEECDRAGILKQEMKSMHTKLEQKIKAIEKRIAAELKKEPEMENKVKLAVSVPGIGKWTALHLLLTTNNFERMLDGRQLACHCGCAPFEHTSGSSVRGKTRVSKMANKPLKTLLTMGAVSIINSKNDFGAYYQRKISEGKNKMSVINAVRNKMLHTVVAVIKRNSPYQLSTIIS